MQNVMAGFIIGVFIFIMVSSANSTVITFDGLATSTGASIYRTGKWAVNDYDFETPSSSVGYVVGPAFTDFDSRTLPFNESDFAVIGFETGPKILTVSHINGDPFSFEQFDATEFFPNQLVTGIDVSAADIHGNSISNRFVTDGIPNDGRGRHNDFQTFYLSPEFSAVYSVRFSIDFDRSLALDNLHVSTIRKAVPEPATVILFGIGLSSLLALSKRRKA